MSIIQCYGTQIIKIKKIISSNDLGYVSNVEIRFKPKGFGNIGSHLLSLIFYLLDTKAKFVKSSNFNERKGFSRSNKSFDFNGMANLILENESQLSISNLGSYEPSIKIYHENGILDMRLKQNTYHLFDKKQVSIMNIHMNILGVVLMETIQKHFTI